MSLVSFKSLVASVSLAVSAAVTLAAAPAFAQNQTPTFANRVVEYNEVTGITQGFRSGFDVNAIAVKGSGVRFAQAATVPEPASILGLLTVGVTSVGSLGKRKKKAIEQLLFTREYVLYQDKYKSTIFYNC